MTVLGYGHSRSSISPLDLDPNPSALGWDREALSKSLSDALEEPEVATFSTGEPPDEGFIEEQLQELQEFVDTNRRDQLWRHDHITLVEQPRGPCPVCLEAARMRPWFLTPLGVLICLVGGGLAAVGALTIVGVIISSWVNAS